MVNKDCCFEFKTHREVDVEKLLTIKSDKPCGLNNLDGKLLKLAAKCHIFNLCFFRESIYPNLWKIAKVTPLPKNCLQANKCVTYTKQTVKENHV